MIGQTISHYRITGELGVGGMGIVYSAQDVRLGRPVALKFVPETLAQDRKVLERLRGEARAASALNHPNICTIHDVGEENERPFIVMELMKGQSLRDRLVSGPLKIQQIVDVGIQAADALDAAHRAGIIHRDIKPANLFLTDRGQIKILDFGLAKLLPSVNSQTANAPTTSTPRPSELTTQGVAMGTVSYMSPEQASGDELDTRTDIFSLGIVLYECATGHRPFTGKTSAVILSATLTKTPIAPVTLNPEVPLRLQEAINNCLEKDLELRYQTAAELRADLKRVKRDLESSKTTAGAVADAAAQADGLGSQRVRQVVAPGAAAEKTSSQQAQGFATRLGVWRGALLAAALVVAGAYAIWSRAPAPAQPITSPEPARPAIEGRLELADTSLRNRNYRAALAYANEVLAEAPDHGRAAEIRNEAQAVIAQSDKAVDEARRLLRAGNLDGASAAVDAVRAIDPSAPELTELSARLVDLSRAQAKSLRQPATSPPLIPPPEVRPAPSTARQETASPPTPPAPAVSTPPPTAPLAVAPPPAPSPEAAPRPPVERVPSLPAPAAAVQVEAKTPPPVSAQDDEDAIRRLVASYARAIETKDLDLFRSLKPNLSGEEERRLREGFRAVSSQQVRLTILSIEPAGQSTVVRLRRQDTIDAGGRRQSTETRQTMTLTRMGGRWVISVIGQ